MIARCAFLASSAHTLPIQEVLLNREDLDIPASAKTDLNWFNSIVLDDDKVDVATIQTYKKAQNELVLKLAKKAFKALCSAFETSSRDSARLLGASANHSGDFLTLLPSYQIGWIFPRKSFNLLCRYRVGLPLYAAPAPCKRCGAESDVFGDQASFCAKGGFLIRRHNAVRDALKRQCDIGKLQVISEERYTFTGNDQKPGDLKVYNVQQNLDFLIDVSVVSPFSSNSLSKTSKKVYAAAEDMENHKIKKYKDGLLGLEPRVHFMETLGGWTKTTDYVIRRIAQCQAQNTDRSLTSLASSTTSPACKPILQPRSCYTIYESLNIDCV